jgi:hypothetical protein
MDARDVAVDPQQLDGAIQDGNTLVSVACVERMRASMFSTVASVEEASRGASARARRAQSTAPSMSPAFRVGTAAAARIRAAVLGSSASATAAASSSRVRAPACTPT